MVVCDAILNSSDEGVCCVRRGLTNLCQTMCCRFCATADVQDHAVSSCWIDSKVEEEKLTKSTKSLIWYGLLRTKSMPAALIRCICASLALPVTAQSGNTRLRFSRFSNSRYSKLVSMPSLTGLKRNGSASPLRKKGQHRECRRTSQHQVIQPTVGRRST